ncbi:MAG: polysaccharide biosynthesis tyrosine autokinase [Gemmatimonadota bacterium]
MTNLNGPPAGPVLPASDGPAAPPRVREHLHVLRRRWWIVALVAVALVAGSWWRQRGQVPHYQAVASVKTSPYAGDFLSGGYAAWLASDPAQLATQVRIIRTQGVLAPVVDSLGLRFQVEGSEYQFHDVVDRALVAPGAPSQGYQLTSEQGLIVLQERGTGRTVDVASAHVLIGPGLTLFLNPDFTPPQPVAVAVVSADAALGRLRGGLDASLARNSVLIDIAYTSPDSIMAARVAQQVAEQYRWHAGGELRRKAQETLDLVRAQRAELEGTMSERLTGGSGGSSVASIFEQNLMGIGDAEASARTYAGQAAIVSRAVGIYENTGNIAVLTALGELVPGASSLYDRLAVLQRDRQQAIEDRGPGPAVATYDTLIVAARDQLADQAAQRLRVLEQQEQAAVAEAIRLRREQDALRPQVAVSQGVDRELLALQERQRMLYEEEFEAEVEAAIEGSPVEIVQPAVVPTVPLPQRRTRTLLLSLVLGLALGMLAALLLEQLDTRVRDPEDVQRSAGVGVIGLIPALRESSGGRPLALSQAEQQTAGAEAFRKLRTNLRFIRAERPQVVAVTSAGPHEGKSVLSANLALALVQQRSRVLLVDGDLRRPVQHTIFGLKRDPGLSDVLVGILPPTQAIRKDVQIPGLYVMPCGTEAPNPSELLGSEEFVNLLNQMRKHFDTIILDTPPVNLVSDAAIVSTVADGTLVVVDAGRTDRHVLASAVNELRQARATLLGVVLNRVDSRSAYGYGYGRFGRYYRSGYYKTESAANGDREWRETLDSLWQQVSPYV